MNNVFDIQVLNQSDLNDTLVEVANPEFSVKSNNFLVRRVQPRYETLDVLSQVVDGERTLRTLLHVPGVRTEIAEMSKNKRGLGDVLAHLFGPSGLVETNSPRYSAMDVMTAVSTVSAFREASTEARLMYSGMIIHILDVFHMRQASIVTSYVMENKVDESPTLDDIIGSITESSVADKIKLQLGKIRTTLSKEDLKRRFSILSYTDLIATNIREISMAIANISFREMWMRDVFKLLGRLVLGDRNQIATYGDLWGNSSLQALTTNSTLVRLAVEHTLSDAGVAEIPSYELNNVADEIARFIGNLSDYEVKSGSNGLVELVTFNRLRNCAILSAMIVGTRRSVADAIMYTVVRSDDVVQGYVDIVNKSKELVGIRPHAPDDLFAHLINDALAFEEDSLLLEHVNDFDVMAIGQANISKTLLGDIVATMCDVTFLSSGVRAYAVSDMTKRLRALNPAFMMGVNTTSEMFAAVALLEPSDKLTMQPRYETEAVVVSQKFSGVWDTSALTKATDLTITIKDIIHTSDNGFGTVIVPLMGNARSIPHFTELTATEGWADIVGLINEISLELNRSGSIKPKLQRAVWSTSVSTKLANWVMSSVAMRGLINRAITKIAYELNTSGEGEILMRTSSLIFGEVALQCAVRTLETMSQLAGGDVFNSEALALLMTPEVVLQFSHMVRPAGDMQL